MSDNKNETNPQDVLFEQVWLPAFAEKCAELGIPASNEEELATAVENAIMAKAALAQSNTSNAGQLHKFANERLHALWGQDTKSAEDEAMKSAAEVVNRGNFSEDAVKALVSLMTAEKSTSTAGA
jgi:2-hydroxychromene-2-carboxylate isomerase